MREQVAISVAEYDVRDDLLKGRVVLDLVAWLEEVVLADHTLVALQVVADEAVPRAVRKDLVPPDDEDLLAHCCIIRTNPRPNTATSSAVRSTSSSRTGRK